MKVLFYSDIHIREVGQFPPYNKIDSNGLTKELNNILTGFTFVRDEIIKNRPNIVIFGGDLYHNWETISTQCLHAAHLGLSQIKQACDEVNAKHYLIPGQHDILCEKNKIFSISNLVGYGTIITEDLLENDIYFIPYSGIPGKLYSSLLQAQEQASLIITHADFQGCRYENWQSSQSNISPKLTKKCLSGDIHLPQDVESVSYPGSLIQNKFYQRDLNNVGGIILYNMETGQLKRVKNTYSRHYVKIAPKNENDHDEYLKKALLLDRQKVLLSIHTELDKEEIESMFQGYDFVYFKLNKINENFKENVLDIDMASSEEYLEKALIDFVNRDRPEAINSLREFIPF